MSFSSQELSAIYNRTSGYCHICHKKLARTNYALYGERGAWEVEHSVAQAIGGTHRANNLYAACIGCNRSKQDASTPVARYANGTKRAPLCRGKRRKAKAEQAVAGGTLGFILGAAFGGPPGALVGAFLGGVLGHDENPDSTGLR